MPIEKVIDREAQIQEEISRLQREAEQIKSQKLKPEKEINDIFLKLSELQSELEYLVKREQSREKAEALIMLQEKTQNPLPPSQIPPTPSDEERIDLLEAQNSHGFLYYFFLIFIAMMVIGLIILFLAHVI